MDSVWNPVTSLCYVKDLLPLWSFLTWFADKTATGCFSLQPDKSFVRPSQLSKLQKKLPEDIKERLEASFIEDVVDITAVIVITNTVDSFDKNSFTRDDSGLWILM